MTLLASTKSKITIHRNGKNVSRLETTGVVLVHLNVVNSDFQQDLRVFYTFVSNESLANY